MEFRFSLRKVGEIMKYIIFFLLSLSITQALANEILPKDSIYHVASEWRDQNNQSFKLIHLKGKPVIISMVYTGCAHACPMTIAKVQEVEQALVKQGLKDYKVVLASFDTTNDTPESLKKYMQSRKLDEKNWIFLSTNQDLMARELAVILGISYKAIGNGDYSHSNVISYINKSGVIGGKVESLNAEIEPILKSAQEEKL